MKFSLKKDKQEKVLEPEFYKSFSGMPTMNYNVYYMKPMEKVLWFFIAFVVGALVGYLFYGGIGKDEFGQPTMLTYILDITISSVTGILAGTYYLPMRTKSIIAKRKQELVRQFRDMLDALTTSLGAGKNVTDSFHSIYQDLKIQYEPDAYIIKELEVIINDLASNFLIEDILEDFGKRSSNDDILSFARVFKVSYRKGGNFKDIIRNTHNVLSDKMEIREEIETLLTANKLETTIMLFMPVVLVGIIKIMSPEFGANFVTPTGIISTTVSIGIFVGAYFLGRQILEIKA